MRSALGKLNATITTLSAHGPLVLVFHNAAAEIEYFRDLGFDTSCWLDSFAAAGAEHTELTSKLETLLIDLEEGSAIASASSSIYQGNPSVAKGSILIQDTQKLFSASGLPGAIPQIGLSKALKALQIPYKRMHNAGNDAHCDSSSLHFLNSCTEYATVLDTLSVYEALVGDGTIRAGLQQSEIRLQEDAKAKAATGNPDNAWEDAWGDTWQ